MDELYQKLASVKSFDLWGSSNSDETSFEVTEGWLNEETGKVKHKPRTISIDELNSWLAETSRIETKSGSEVRHTLVMRLVLVNVNVGDKKVLLADSVQRRLLQAFGLELAHGYAKTCISDVSAIPPPEEQPDLRAYSFCFLPKLAAVWSQTQPPADGPRYSITQGIIFVQKEEEASKGKFGEENWMEDKLSERALLTQLLASSWDESLYRTAMLPLLLFSLLLLTSIHKTDLGITKKIRCIEGQTGHHIFKSIDAKQSHEDKERATATYAQSSAEASGCASKLAGAVRKGKIVESILRFMTSSIDGTDSGEARQDRVCMRQHVRHLQARLDILNVDLEYTLKRVQIQISALAGLISGHDSFANIELARSQKELAIQSHRDSLSMKTLAIVTMFFLPGSFISALFSTQMFDWEAVASKTGGIGLPTTPQFKLYWIITVLLTVATFSLYFLWYQLLKRQYREKAPETRSDDKDEVSLAEKGTM